MAETINCPACGTRNSFDDRFCSNCGASLLPATGATTHLAGKVCSSCGTPLPQHAEFCTECGQRVGSPPASYSQPQPQARVADSASYSQPHPQAHHQQRPATRSIVCPSCRDVPLQMSERQGIEVEYCPACRGVWLDRGELDKIIERATQQQGRSTQYPNQQYDRSYPAYQQRHHDDYRRKKKRDSFLEELFDFD